MAIHSSTLAWKIPWTEEPDRLQSMEFQRVRHNWATSLHFLSSVQFSHSVVSDCLWPHGLQHVRFLCPSPSPGVCSNSCPLSQWCHPTISSSVILFSSCPQSCPASGSFPMSCRFQSKSNSFLCFPIISPLLKEAHFLKMVFLQVWAPVQIAHSWVRSQVYLIRMSESEILGSAFYQVSSCVSFAYQGLKTCKDLGRIE